MVPAAQAERPVCVRSADLASTDGNEPGAPIRLAQAIILSRSMSDAAGLLMATRRRFDSGSRGAVAGRERRPAPEGANANFQPVSEFAGA